MNTAPTQDRSLHCQHFGTCGGCDRLETPIEQQLTRKRQRLADALPESAKHLEIELDPPRKPPQWFRSKLLQPIRTGADGRPRTGLFARGSQELVAIETCKVQDPALTRFAQRAEALFAELGLQAYDRDPPTDGDRGGRHEQAKLRAVFARLVPGTQEMLCGVVTTGGLFPQSRELAEGLVEAARKLRCARGRSLEPVGVVRNLNDGDGNALFGDRDLPLLGRDHQIDRVGRLGTDNALRLQVSMRSFYQVHRGADALLFRPAFEMLGPLEGADVIDGYGGVGSFGLRALALGAGRLRIVENAKTACRDAAQNLARNGYSKRGEVVEQAFDEFEPTRAADIVFVDPPRKGLGTAGLAVLRACGAERVLYVSCSTVSLRRDLEDLATDYSVERARLVDLFPHTGHQESVVLLRRHGAHPAT